MRTLVTLAAAVPLALMAACGETTPADQTHVEPMEAEVAELDTSSAALPEVPRSALDTLDFAGTYTREADSGTERLTLNPEDDSYEYTAADGTQSSGSFTRMEDDRRLAIEDFDGQAAYFSVADGSIYRLADVDTPADRITVTGQYRRDQAIPARETSSAEDTSAAQETGPGATVDSVADKRQ